MFVMGEGSVGGISGKSWRNWGWVMEMFERLWGMMILGD